MSPEECRKYLRYLELDAYAKMVSVLRAQGPLTDNKQKLLQQLATALHISNDRHQAEVRRAVNDDKLSDIAEQLFGPNTDNEWSMEGRRILPLIQRMKSRNPFTTFANSIGLTTAMANEKQPIYQRKSEGTLISNSKDMQDQIRHGSENESKFLSRKRKRSVSEIMGMNNGIISNCSSSNNYSNNYSNNRNTIKKSVNSPLPKLSKV